MRGGAANPGMLCRMSTTFYVRRGSRVAGPIGSSELRRRAKQGTLLSSDEISRDRDQWILAREIQELEFGTPAVHLKASAQTIHFADTETVEAIPPGLALPVPPSNTKLDACPDCSQLVSLRAFTCPHCGCPLRDLPPTPAPVAIKFPFSWKIAVACWLAGTLSAVLAAIVAAVCVSVAA